MTYKYVQTMLRRTEGSSKEEQIYQKEQILAELQVTDEMMKMMHYWHVNSLHEDKVAASCL